MSDPTPITQAKRTKGHTYFISYQVQIITDTYEITEKPIRNHIHAQAGPMTARDFLNMKKGLEQQLCLLGIGEHVVVLSIFELAE